jgi:hypothetical protein
MKTDFAQAIVVMARRILESAEAGRVYDPKTIEWAAFIVKANT